MTRISIYIDVVIKDLSIIDNSATIQKADQKDR